MSKDVSDLWEASLTQNDFMEINQSIQSKKFDSGFECLSVFVPIDKFSLINPLRNLGIENTLSSDQLKNLNPNLDKVIFSSLAERDEVFQILADAYKNVIQKQLKDLEEIKDTAPELANIWENIFKEEMEAVDFCVKEVLDPNHPKYIVLDKTVDELNVVRLPDLNIVNPIEPVKVIILDKVGENNPLSTRPQFTNDKLKDKIINTENALGNHSCHVAGIVNKICPNIKLIIKDIIKNNNFLLSGYKQDYGAKIVNTSTSVSRNLEGILEDHIVVKACGNDSGLLPLTIKASLKDHHVKDHLILVVNLQKDGLSLHPSSTIPGLDTELQDLVIAAPGSDILSCVTGNKEKESTGTSMSAPIVTGAVCLILGNFPNLSKKQVVQVLKDSANKFGIYAQREYFGNGLLDIENAFKYAFKEEIISEILGQDAIGEAI